MGEGEGEGEGEGGGGGEGVRERTLLCMHMSQAWNNTHPHMPQGNQGSIVVVGLLRQSSHYTATKQKYKVGILPMSIV